MSSSIAPVAPTPWYRHFWPWFIIGLLGVSVVGSLTTVYLAVSGADSDVRDSVTRDAKAYYKDTSAEDLARRLGVGARLRVAEDGQALVLTAWSAEGEVPARLVAHLAHPTLSERDLHLVFERGDDGVHRADLPAPLEGRWEIAVMSAAPPSTPEGVDDASPARWEIVTRSSFGPGAEIALGAPKRSSG